MRFLPREEKFYHFFKDQTRLTLKAAGLMLSAARNGNSEVEQAAAAIHKLEAEADTVVHQIYKKLSQTFITPIDPEDIHALSSSLDDVIDGIEDCMHRLSAYRIEPIPPTVVQLCEKIRDCCDYLDQAIKALEEDKPVSELCVQVDRLEDEADTIMRAAVQGMFRDAVDPITLMKQKEVHEYLEATTDRCEDVADVLRNIVVKNA